MYELILLGFVLNTSSILSNLEVKTINDLIDSDVSFIDPILGVVKAAVHELSCTCRWYVL